MPRRSANDREVATCQRLLGGTITKAELVDRNIVCCKTTARGTVQKRGDSSLIGPGFYYVDIRNKKIYRDHPNESPPADHLDRIKWIKTASFEQLELVSDDQRKSVQRAIEARIEQLAEIEQQQHAHAERAKRAAVRANADWAGLI